MKLLFVLTAAAAAPLLAADFDPATRAKTIAPFIDEDTMAAGHIELGPLINALHSVAQVWPDLARELEFLRSVRKAGAKDLFWVFSMTDLRIGGPLDRFALGFLVIPLAGADEKTLMAAMPTKLGGMKLETARVGDALVAGDYQTIERVRQMKAAQRPELIEAWAAAGESDAQLLLMPTADDRRAVDELVPTLPAALGGGPGTALTRGCQWAAAGFKISPSVGIQVKIQSADNPSARALRELIIHGYQALGQSRSVRRDVPDWANVSPLLTPAVNNDALTLTLTEQDGAIAKLNAALIMPLVRSAIQASDRKVAASHMNQIYLAMVTYEQRNALFPARAICDKDGKPLLSWRVATLPWLGQKELYSQFHLDEPWDSDHNKPLIDRMPEIFKSSNLDRGNKTRFLVPVGKGLVYDGVEPVSLKQIARNDGVTNTFFMVEVREDHAVIWTKPDDLEVDLDHPLVGLEDSRPGGFIAMLADRSVHFIANTASPKALKGIFTWNGGEDDGGEILYPQ